MSSSRYKLVCAHCRSRVRIRTSDGQHIFLRIAYLQCTNEACGWTARAEFQTTHELSPSATPNPEARLPQATTAMRRQAMQPDASEQPELFDETETEQDHA